MPPTGAVPQDNTQPPTASPAPTEGDGMMPPYQDGMAPPQGSEFDTGFDPGVDTDENEDPKKFIQQLAGKLSQSLRKYNSQLPQPDVDLNKYVAGMVNKQAVQGLPPEEVKVIIDRMQEDEDADNMGQPPSDGGMQQGPDTGEAQVDAPQQPQDGQMPQQPAFESIERQQRIEELFQDMLAQDDGSEEILDSPEPNAQGSYRARPFKSPNFS